MLYVICYIGGYLMGMLLRLSDSEYLKLLMDRSDEYRRLPNLRICYTYFLGWSILRNYYYGVQYSKKCHPRDLGVKYRSSSKLVKELWDKYGPPDIMIVHRVFWEDSEAAIAYEKYVLEELDVLRNNKFLNRNISGSICVEDCIKGIMVRVKNGTNTYSDRSKASASAKKRNLMYRHLSFSDPEYRRMALEAKRRKKLEDSIKNAVMSQG
jgi:hypothetical protein